MSGKKKRKALRGTRFACVGTAEEIATELHALLGRGASHERKRQLGCGVIAAGVIAGVSLLFFTKQYDLMAAIGVVVILVWIFVASLDPELAEDRRVQMARKLLTGTRRADRFAGRTLELELELNEYESEPPQEKKPLRSGRLQTTHAQRWLLLRCGALEFEVHVEATLVQDGIEVVRREESERFAVRVSGVETPIRARGWTDQSKGRLCTMPELEAALDAALDAMPALDSESE